MTNEEIQIPRKITNQLLHQAQLSPSTEICGLIGSRNGIPVSCYQVDNGANQPQKNFLLDAKQQIASMAKMRELGEDLFAIYHSHPTSPASPSQADITMAAYPDAVYLIISLNTKGVLELRGFRIKPDKVQELSLVLAEK